MSLSGVVLLLVFLGAGVSALYAQCIWNDSRIGDGRCDDVTNIADCGYDGGDCCYCFCVDGLDNTCGWVGYECRDPGYLIGEMLDCSGGLSVDAPCSTDASIQIVVDNTASAAALADAILCSGGTFHVEWRGHVIVGRTIEVANGTVLHITGAESGAEMEATLNTRLFTVINASLDISNMNISGGYATFGGAIAATASNLSLDKTSFMGNGAFVGGGTLYATLGSNVSCGTGTLFDGNHAGVQGGALYIGGGSSVTFHGHTSFTNNVANKFGGALYVHGSDVSSAADVSFTNNAGDDGGALYVNGSILSWAADTYFIDNVAGNGGALYALESNVFWAVNANFTNNTAEDTGGALCVLGSNISWVADAIFASNTAGRYGGALYVRLNSNVSWAVHASFIRNTAVWSGGTLYVHRSDVFWAADASFIDNNAIWYGGGAMYVFESKVSWAATASFINNTAGKFGGALDVVQSTVSWSADASFISNIAGNDGGAMQVEGSDASWVADATFINNTAEDDGGALYVVGSNISWAIGGRFEGNIAVRDGGALSIKSGSVVSWRAQASFLHNTAGTNGGALFINGAGASLEMDTIFFGNSASGDGGAVYIYTSYDKAQESSLNIGSNTTFLRNLCGSDGGAMALAAVGSMTFRLENATFSQNLAHAAGGAVSVKGLGVGPHFTGVTFMSNQAQIGGAAYVTSSGTAITEDQSNALRQNPTMFDRCTFIHNEAWATGGAVDTGAGLDVIANTYFVGNTARAGGALRLAGTTTLHNCTFVENTSDEGEGPAVSNAGFIYNMTVSSFFGNAFECKPGKFRDFDETNPHVFDVVCKGCDIPCPRCSTSQVVPMCTEELEHTKSYGGDTTVEVLEIDDGYWRATNISKKVLPCYNTKSCLGGVTGAFNYCSKGYEGPYCSVCREGYSPSLSHICRKCSGSIIAAIATTLAMILAIIVLVVSLAYLVCHKSTGAGGRLLASWKRRLLSLKIIVIVWQILTQFSSVASVIYPDVYQVFLDGVQMVNLDLTWILSAECIMYLDFHHRLIMSTLGPPIALTILGAMYIIARRRSASSHVGSMIMVHQEVDRRYLSLVLLLTFLVYSSVSSTLFRMFACDKLDDGQSYLRADYRIDCNSSTHRTLQIYAGCMIVVYTAGIPVLYGLLLYRNRHVLRDEGARQEDEVAKSISNLWELYKPDRFYYDLIECGRRILLVGVVVFMFPNTVAQVAVALMLATCFMIVSEIMSPYQLAWDTWVSRMGHVIVFSSMYLALLLKIDVSGESKNSQRMFEASLIIAHACMFLVAIFQGVVVTYQWFKRRG